MIEENQLEAEKIFNATEAAEYLRISRDWLYKNINKIPHTNIGGCKFLESDLDEWIKVKTNKKNKVSASIYRGEGCDYKIK